MRVLPALALALRPLRRRPVRTLLLLQGTIWGVAVALFPSAVIEGTRRATLVQGAHLGADRIAIAPDPTAPGAAALERADVARVRSALESEGVEVRAAGAMRVLRLYGEDGRDGALVASDPEVPRARGLELARGRWLAPGDPPTACVLEARAATRLAATAPVPGSTIEVEGEDGRRLRLEVVGVARPQDDVQRRTNDLGFDVTHPLYDRVGRALLLALGIPRVEDAWKRSDAIVYVPLPDGAVDWIQVRTTPEQVKRGAELAAAALLEAGRTPVVLRPLVLPLVLGKDIDRFDAVRAALFLACLVMGAVVMANLGLLTVLQRRHEIAVRRVEGATRPGIAAQFLLEGVLLTAVGCALGSLLAMGLAALRVALEPVTGFAWVFPWDDALVVFVVALVIGCAASLLPALRAARQQPVDGLAGEGR